MTYLGSSLSYWIGQANDLSTGRHPPGWVSGQRWLTTAAQWMASADDWFLQATDTSTGRHPPGWASGQLWSTTAAQWMAAYDAMLPPSGVPELSVTQSKTNPNGHGDGWSLNLNRAGYWRLTWTGNSNIDPPAGPATYRLYANNTVLDTGTLDSQNCNAYAKIGLTSQLVFGPTECHVNLSNEFQFTGTTATLTASFMATQQYPH